ncbi:MAG: ATP-grasp domain-containing protein, partial [Fimbriiglobus sp.]
GMIGQEYHPGTAASVAFLIGPRETIPLVPTFQLLSDDGRFRYGGAELPIPPDLADRAVAVGRAAIADVPGLCGFVAVDLVLGPAADGSAESAIEINPRVSMAYIGLRALYEGNLAAAMLNVVAGDPVGEMRWKLGRLRFRPAGEVEFLDPPTEPAGGGDRSPPPAGEPGSPIIA